VCPPLPAPLPSLDAQATSATDAASNAASWTQCETLGAVFVVMAAFR
jgi:hypothetical protein